MAGIIVTLILGTLIFQLDGKSLLTVGDVAPDFTATLSSGETVKLTEYRSKQNVVLFFYPRDFTPGCTKEVCSFRDNYAEVTKHNAVLLGVSYDDERSHELFIAKHNLPFPLISDTDKSISTAYGVTDRLGGLIPGAMRVTYVIDKQGIIRNVIHREIFISKHIDDIIDGLEHIGRAEQR